MAVVPIPSGRTSDLLSSNRLLQQLRDADRDLLITQSQLASGRRIFAPSEDAPAAQRAISLQRLLEQKQQIESNLQTSNSYLAATDSALSTAAGTLADIRGLAVSVVGTTTSETQRAAAVEEIEQAIEQLFDLGNQSFRGRHLFAGGSSDSTPFAREGEFIRYDGNQVELRSYADVDFLVSTNSHGQEVFGTFSPGQQGRVDLNPLVSNTTRLADLRGGAGITLGTIEISTGTTTTNVDLSQAETLGDVVRLIETASTTNQAVIARLTDDGLTVELNAPGGGTLTIEDAPGGTTAAELGILEPNGVHSNTPVGGADLDPLLSLHTSLDDLLGVRATAAVNSTGIANDLVFEFADRGTAGNGLNVQFVDDSLRQAGPGLIAGSETAQFTSAPLAAVAGLRLAGADNDIQLVATTPGTAANNIQINITTAAIGNAANVTLAGDVLTIQIDSGGATTVGTLQTEIANEGTFTASLDTSLEPGASALSTIDPASAGISVGNTGNSGAEANTLLVNIVPGQTTANQVIAAVDGNPATAALFNVFPDNKDNLGVIVPGSGVVDVDATSSTTGGSGVELDQAAGLQIGHGGETFLIDVSGAETIHDLLNVLNHSDANILAEINGAGTGIDVRSRLSGANLSIGENGGQTATHLGIRTFAAETRLSELNFGIGFEAAEGVDFHIHRTDGVTLSVDVSGATSVQDVLDSINAHVDNVGPNQIIAQLAEFGGGIELIEQNAVGGQTLSVEAEFGSFAANFLGLIDFGETETLATGTTTQTLTGRDTNPLEASGVYNTLLRLKTAVENNDINEIGRQTEALDVDLDRVTFARADAGARSQNLDVLTQRVTDEQVQIISSISEEIDADLVEAVSRLTNQQTSLQASLQASAQTFRLSLLDFL